MKDLDRTSGIGGVGGSSRSLKTDDDLSSTLVEIVDLTPAKHPPSLQWLTQRGYPSRDPIG